MHFVSITYSVAIQELCRWGFYLLLNRAEAGLNIVSANPKSPFNRPVFAFGKLRQDYYNYRGLRVQ